MLSAPAGLRKRVARIPSRGKIIWKGKDGVLPLTPATLPLSAAGPVVVQVYNSDNSNCWGASFAAFIVHTDEKYKAKIP